MYLVISALWWIVIATRLDRGTSTNVTLSSLRQTWDQSHKLCELIDQSSLASYASVHWLPSQTTLPSQVWIGGESSFKDTAWIVFSGCFKKTAKFSLQYRISDKDDDVILDCYRHCNGSFYITSGYCFCADKDDVVLSENSCGRKTKCSGDKGGYCGFSSSPTCLCRYDSIPKDKCASSQTSSSCDNADREEFECQYCVQNKRVICSPTTASRPVRFTYDQPGFTCPGQHRQLYAEFPRINTKNMDDRSLYGFPDVSNIYQSASVYFCVAFNITDNFNVAFIEKPCNSTLRAMCRYNDSVLLPSVPGRSDSTTPDSSTSDILITIIVLVVVLVIVGIVIFFRKAILQRICSSKPKIAQPNPEANFSRRFSDQGDDDHNEDQPGEQPDTYSYNILEVRGEARVSIADADDGQGNEENHYDSTRHDAYDILGVKPPVVEDYDTTKSLISGVYDTTKPLMFGGYGATKEPVLESDYDTMAPVQVETT